MLKIKVKTKAQIKFAWDLPGTKLSNKPNLMLKNILDLPTCHRPDTQHSDPSDFASSIHEGTQRLRDTLRRPVLMLRSCDHAQLIGTVGVAGTPGIQKALCVPPGAERATAKFPQPAFFGKASL